MVLDVLGLDGLWKGLAGASFFLVASWALGVWLNYRVNSRIRKEQIKTNLLLGMILEEILIAKKKEAGK